METGIRCPACGARIAGGAKTQTACPACGARLRGKARSEATSSDRDGRRDSGSPAPRKKKKRKKSRSSPNYALYAVIGGGVLVAGALAWVVIIGIQEFRQPVADFNNPNNAVVQEGGPSQPPPVPAGPVWAAKIDPPREANSYKKDLALTFRGEPQFASGHSPFVADLVPIIVGVESPPVISVYDMRTGERARTAKAIRLAQGATQPGGSFVVALGPDGKTLAAQSVTTTGKGRQATTTREALIYRLGEDAPVARVPLPQHLSWMEFGRDENQLIVVSASPASGFFANAYDIKKPEEGTIILEIPRSGNRWRNGFHNPESLAISPGRNYLAVGEGRSVDLIQLTDGKLAGSFMLPGDCKSITFSPDGKELTAHSGIAPQRRAANVTTQYQWTTFSLADGKQTTQSEVTGGPDPGPILVAGPKSGLAVHGDRARVMVTDTRIGAPVYTTPFRAVRCFDGDALLGYDAKEKRLVVQRIDADQLAAGEKALAEIFGPRPAPVAADRATLAKPSAPGPWQLPIEVASKPPELVGSHTIAGGADFVMPWTGKSALTAVMARRIETPRDRYALQWQRIDLAGGKSELAVELWPSMLPPGQVPGLAGNGSVLADQTADGSRLAMRDAANLSRIDIWDQSGKRLQGFLPYGTETQVDSLAWTGENRLVTMGGGKVTGWEIPGPKAAYEVTGYSGAHVLAPTRQWIGVQSDRFIDFYDTATGKPLGRLAKTNTDEKPWHAFAVSGDGLRLAAIELIRAGYNDIPGIWEYATWDLKTGQKQQAERLFAGFGVRGHHLTWLGPRLLLAGGADVIDLDARATTVTLGLNPPLPVSSPDGRYWGARSNQPKFTANQPQAIDSIMATRLDETIQSLPRPAFADVIFRVGVPVEAVGRTGNGARDAVVRSMFNNQLTAEGFQTGRGGWQIAIVGERVAGTGSLETEGGGKISIPSIRGRIQLIDPTGGVVWETPASGGFDMMRSKYRTRTETVGTPGLGGGSITHFNFGLRDPQDAMADEAWDNFVEGLKLNPRFPRVLARVNAKFVVLPLTLPVTGK